MKKTRVKFWGYAFVEAALLALFMMFLPQMAFRSPLAIASGEKRANDLVQFLAGHWDDVSFEVASGKPIKKETYPETMVIKDFDTLTITAHGLRDGKDLTKDMRLELRDNQITLSQGTFTAKGTREDNVYTLKGESDGIEYRLRLYALGEKYVFQRETWKAGKIQQVDMSYLIRKK